MSYPKDVRDFLKKNYPKADGKPKTMLLDFLVTFPQYGNKEDVAFYDVVSRYKKALKITKAGIFQPLVKVLEMDVDDDMKLKLIELTLTELKESFTRAKRGDIGSKE